MEGLYHRNAALSDSAGHFDFAQELVRHGLQSIGRPSREPVDCGAVDNRWEISDPISKRGSNGRESEDDVEAVLASLQEICKQLSRRSVLAPAFLLGWASYSFAEISFFVCRENIWYFTGIKDIVDIFQEALLLYLSIREQERCLLAFCTDLSHEVLHVLSPFLRSVVLLDFNLEDVEVSHERCESGH